MKDIIFLLTAHQCYIRADNESSLSCTVEDDKLFSAIAQTYVPFLNLLERLASDAIPCAFAVVLSPALCTLLEDKLVHARYCAWLDRRIELGQAELERCKNDAARYSLAQRYLKEAQAARYDFSEKYKCRLVQKFGEYARKGRIVLLATAASNAFLPHFMSVPESVAAQIEAGIVSHKFFFGSIPDGFYLPYMGYAEGIDKIIKSYGIRYTVLDSRAILFSKDMPCNGIFEPVRSHNSLILFANDTNTMSQLSAFEQADVYLNRNRDIGYEFDVRQLQGFIADGSPRISTGFCYYGHTEAAYNAERAAAHVTEDAAAFVASKTQMLSRAAQLATTQNVSLVCTIPLEHLGMQWAEGLDWLETVVRTIVAEQQLSISTCEALIDGEKRFSFQKIEPYPSAAGDSGYGEALLDSKNAWRMRYVMKAVKRMVDLAGRFDESSGLKCRMLNIGAKAVLLAQSGDWPQMMHGGIFPETARNCFSECIQMFSTVFESLGSNTVSTEWLTNIERKYPIFPWMNYKIFSKKH